jgi:hypothetical protein
MSDGPDIFVTLPPPTVSHLNGMAAKKNATSVLVNARLVLHKVRENRKGRLHRPIGHDFHLDEETLGSTPITQHNP